MKKLLTLLAALLMLVGCAALAEETMDYVGYWEMSGVELAGTSYDPTALGLTASITFYDDGTCDMEMMGEITEGTWVATETGVETTDSAGVVDAMTYADGTLTVEQDGMKLIFTLVEGYTMPLSGLAVADFNGDWVFTYVELDGETYSASALGAEMTLHLEDGAGHMVMTSSEGVEEYDALCEVEEIEHFGTALYFMFLEDGQATEDGLLLLMYDNGELVWYTWDDTYEMFYCFERAE